MPGRKTNKSAKIRDYLSEHPDAMPKEVVAALKEQGIKVTSQQVSTTKTNAKKQRTGRRGLIATKQRAATNGSFTAEDLAMAMKLGSAKIKALASAL